MDKKIKFGNSTLEIAPIVFGGNVFGWTLDEQASFRILDQFVDLGFDAIDTANNYAHWLPGNVGGESETIIGNWLAQRGGRDKVIVMTKVGGRFGYDTAPNVKAEYIKEQVEHSLRRLRTDYIDLYQTHYDVEETPVEETLRAYDDLIKAGKVRHIGTSNMSPERIVESLAVSAEKGLPAYVSLQPEYNLFDRAKYENLYRDLALEKKLAVIPYYALASGFLSGKYKNDNDFEQSARGGGIKKNYWNERGKNIVAALEKVASSHQTSMSAVALAWLLAQDSITAPIVSGTKDSHLQAFVEAADLRLSNDELQMLDEASAY